MNYRGFGLAWLVLWLTLPAMPAGAEMLTLGELGLDTANVWQRGSVDEEADLDSIVLRERTAASPLEIFLARHRVRLKLGEAKFIEQLEQSWRRRYGAGAELDWLDVAGTRWRVCRRPSQSGDGYVFQIVTVHAGEVYQLVAMAPEMVKALPESVRTFLASAVWGGVKPPDRQEAAAAPVGLPANPAAVAKPVNVVSAVPVGGAEAAAPATAGVAKPQVMTPAPAIAAKPERQWRLLRSVIALPGSKAWPGLAEAEAAQLGSNGLVKGLGLSAEAAGIDGFLEGFSWQKGEGAGERRQPYRRHWQVLWPAFPERWRAGGDLAFDLEFLADTAGLGPGGDMTVRFELTPICTQRIKVVKWLDGLEAQGPEAMSQLAEMACVPATGAPAPVTVAVAAGEYPAEAAARVKKHVVLTLPADWQQGIRPKSSAEVPRLVLTLRFQISEGGHAPGDAMFRQAAVVFVFGPEV
ncbi:MAG: hypothetical protein PHR30_01565 [Gallionellaceae bacterium]|nr:hypothetical protein [Gallionellaceae bacterium]